MTPVIDPAYGLGLAPDENRLVAYNPLWPAAYDAERGRIAPAVSDVALSVEHIGSTAIPGLPAKPIVDLLIGVAHLDEGLAMIPAMEALGYEYATNHGIPDHHIFGLGKVRTYLVHVVQHDGDQWRALLRFRDRLRADDALRDAYATLKTDLAKTSMSRAAYTDGKAAFVTRVTADPAIGAS